ncbi:MAG: sugar-binding protein [Gemmataceae bacterium]
MKFHHWLLVSLALGLACLTGCSRDNRTRVAFVSNNTAQFWTIAEAGTKKAEKELPDFKCEFRRPQDGSVNDQKNHIDDLVARGVKAIAISINDPDIQTEHIDSIVDRGIPVITQDNDAPKSKRLCYIGTDNYSAGKEVGKLVKKALPEGGVIAIFVGKPDPLNARQRRQGVLDELAGEKDAKGPMYGKYELHGTFYDNTDETKAKDNAADVITKLADQPYVCLIGLWQYNPPAILTAVREAKKLGTIKIVGFDEDENTLIGIKEGHIDGTVVQQPFEFGYQSVKLMAQLAKGDKSGLPKDGILYIPHQVITKDNVDEFHKKLNELLGK